MEVSEALKEKKDKEAGWLFVDVEETKQNYAIPSAFVKYTEYLKAYNLKPFHI